MEYFAHGGIVEEATNSGHMDGNWGWGWLGMVTMTILFVLIVLLVIKYVSSNSRTTTTNNQDALAVLNKRYASGDITRKEFEDVKKAISNK